MEKNPINSKVISEALALMKSIDEWIMSQSEMWGPEQISQILVQKAAEICLLGGPDTKEGIKLLQEQVNDAVSGILEHFET